MVWSNNTLNWAGNPLVAVEEGVDNSDDAALAIRPPSVNSGDIDYILGGEPLPTEWTQIDSVTARMRARLVQYGDDEPDDQDVECTIGDSNNSENVGEVTFTVSGTDYQTYESSSFSNGITLPKLISQIDFDDFVNRWIMNEQRSAFATTLEISAMEVCVYGS